MARETGGRESEQTGGHGSRGARRLLRRPLLRLAACGLVLETLFVALVLAGGLVPSRLAPFLGLDLAAFAVFLVALRVVGRAAPSRRLLATVIGFAALFRVTLLAAPPVLSDDVFRYVWDGAVLRAGRNPYAYAPASPARAEFAPLAARVNHADISTVYPPLAEAVFAASGLLHPAGPPERGMRLAFVLAEVLVVQALLALGAGRIASGKLVLAYAWCPLAVVEVAGNGHLDVLAIGLLLLGLRHLSDGRKNVSMLFLGASASVKYLALAVAVALRRTLGGWRTAGVFLLLLASYVPFLGAGDGLVRGLREYAARWQFNAPLFALLVGALEAADVTGRLKAAITWARSACGDPAWMNALYFHVYPQEVARWIVGLAFAALVLAAGRGRRRPVEVAALVVLGFLLLTPTLHPWYVLWGLAFAGLVPSRAFLALAGLVPLSYHALAGRESSVMTALEFVPFLVLVGLDVRRCAGRRRARAASGGPGPGPGAPAIARRSFLGPPWPFQKRSAWRRFREDTLPRIAGWGRSFWSSPYRNLVLAAIVLLAGVTLVLSVRQLPAVGGRVVAPAGTAGAEVEVIWYVTRAEAFENLGRPYATTWGEATDVSQSDAVLARGKALTDRDGRFSFPGGVALAWPGAKGPFVRLRIRATDPVSGKVYAVRRFRVAGGDEIVGIDTASWSGGTSWSDALARIEIPPPGRIYDLALRGDLVATAEGPAGLRLYRLPAARAPELLAHRLASGAEEVRAVAFAPVGLLAFRTTGFDVLEPDPALRVVASLDGAWQRAVSASDAELALVADNRLSRLKPGPPPQLQENVSLGDPRRKTGDLGDDAIRLVGRLLFYLDTDGTLRLTDLGSPFRAPATLGDEGGPLVGFDLVAEESMVVVASSQSVSVHDVAQPEATHRTGRVVLADVRPLAVFGRVVVGEKGVAVLDVARGRAPAVRLSVPLASDEVEAASAFVVPAGPRGGGATLVVPKLEAIDTRAVAAGLRFDLVKGRSVEDTRPLRDTALLAGARFVDLATGAVREEKLAPGVRVFVRADGRNRRLVFATTGDGRVVYGGVDGRLVVEAWGGAGGGP